MNSQEMNKPLRPTPSDATRPVDLVAAREHTTRSRKTRVHVIVCHDLDARSHSLYEMFRFADRVSPEVLDAMTRELASDILGDVDLLIGELGRIRNFTLKQLEKLGEPKRKPNGKMP